MFIFHIIAKQVLWSDYHLIVVFFYIFLHCHCFGIINCPAFPLSAFQPFYTVSIEISLSCRSHPLVKMHYVLYTKDSAFYLFIFSFGSSLQCHIIYGDKKIPPPQNKRVKGLTFKFWIHTVRHHTRALWIPLKTSFHPLQLYSSGCVVLEISRIDTASLTGGISLYTRATCLLWLYFASVYLFVCVCVCVFASNCQGTQSH